MPAAKPMLLIAELTHRCPLGCPYCSNPLALTPREAELDLATWARVFAEAAALGADEVELSGGEPGARRDLPELAATAHEAGLRTRLVTSGANISTRMIRDLWEAGLGAVQISFQDSGAVSSDRIAGHRGAFARKCALAAEVKRLGLPLTIEFVVHRANIDRIAAMVDLALDLKADRVVIAFVEYVGWALKNLAALMPAGETVARVNSELDALRQRHGGHIAIDVKSHDNERAPDVVLPALTISPSGNVLPRLAAGLAPSDSVWNVRENSLAEIWAKIPVEIDRCALGHAARAELPAADAPNLNYSHRRM
jgi:pyrroloquinoline quinone biosynthesis protein E